MTKNVLWAISLALLSTWPFAAPPASRPGAAIADDPDAEEAPSAEFVEYRCLSELGQITVTDGMVRGEKSVARLEARAPELARRGIFACVDADKPHSFHRNDELDGHRFETVVTINPPGDDDEDWTRHLIVRVDGRKKVDCSIGASADGETVVWGVTLFPEEGTVEISASDADGGELVMPEGFEKLDNAKVITDSVLQPPPDDDAPEKPDMEKA